MGGFIKKHWYMWMLAAGSLAAFHLYLVQHQQRLLTENHLEALSVRQRFLSHQVAERVRQNQIIANVNQFVERAQRLGLTRDRWSVYEVDLNEALTFGQLAQILDVCINTPAYYFTPINMRLRVGENTDGQATDPTVATGKNAQAGEGDVLLSLTGAFYARQQ